MWLVQQKKIYKRFVISVQLLIWTSPSQIVLRWILTSRTTCLRAGGLKRKAPLHIHHGENLTESGLQKSSTLTGRGSLRLKTSQRLHWRVSRRFHHVKMRKANETYFTIV
ncbi:hypothetical protein L6452_44716 [Arctium lappa]|uniref:Uncharacterized protein n=1 Tax=Arctium lappa TaxID=4217 RepID=A0ACB8XGZ4_ARCLA|nr:hypothetical protein L6452_44716 [Arctium lappa]